MKEKESRSNNIRRQLNIPKVEFKGDTVVIDVPHIGIELELVIDIVNWDDGQYYKIQYALNGQQYSRDICLFKDILEEIDCITMNILLDRTKVSDDVYKDIFTVLCGDVIKYFNTHQIALRHSNDTSMAYKFYHETNVVGYVWFYYHSRTTSGILFYTINNKAYIQYMADTSLSTFITTTSSFWHDFAYRVFANRFQRDYNISMPDAVISSTTYTKFLDDILLQTFAAIPLFVNTREHNSSHNYTCPDATVQFPQDLTTSFLIRNHVAHALQQLQQSIQEATYKKYMSHPDMPAEIREVLRRPGYDKVIRAMETTNVLSNDVLWIWLKYNMSADLINTSIVTSKEYEIIQAIYKFETLSLQKGYLNYERTYRTRSVRR